MSANVWRIVWMNLRRQLFSAKVRTKNCAQEYAERTKKSSNWNNNCREALKMGTIWRQKLRYKIKIHKKLKFTFTSDTKFSWRGENSQNWCFRSIFLRNEATIPEWMHDLQRRIGRIETIDGTNWQGNTRQNQLLPRDRIQCNSAIQRLAGALHVACFFLYLPGFSPFISWKVFFLPVNPNCKKKLKLFGFF